MTSMAERSVLTLCDILTNKIDEVKHDKARGLSLRKFSKDVIGTIKRYNKDIHEILGDSCESLYGVPSKRRRLSSMERSDQEKSSSENTGKETSEDCGPEKESSNLAPRSPVIILRSIRWRRRTQDNNNGVDNENSKVMTVITPAQKKRSRRLNICSTTRTKRNTHQATTVAREDNDNESSCPPIVVATQDASTQANRYIGDNLPGIILLNSGLNVKQLDLQQLNPEAIEDIKKQLN